MRSEKEEKEGGKKGGGKEGRGEERDCAPRGARIVLASERSERQGASAGERGREGRGRAQRDLSWRMRKKERGERKEGGGKKGRGGGKDCAPRGARISLASERSERQGASAARERDRR